MHCKFGSVGLLDYCGANHTELRFLIESNLLVHLFRLTFRLQPGSGIALFIHCRTHYLLGHVLGLELLEENIFPNVQVLVVF